MTVLNRQRAFTFVELMVCLAIISILMLSYSPKSQKLSTQARSAVLKRNLLCIRTSLQEYYKLNFKYPASLNTLVTAGFISKLPVDPFDDSKKGWDLVKLSEESNEICDVKSFSDTMDNAGISVSEY